MKTHSMLCDMLTSKGLVVGAQLLNPLQPIKGLTLWDDHQDPLWGVVLYKGVHFDHHLRLHRKATKPILLYLLEDITAITKDRLKNISYIQLTDARKGWALGMSYIYDHPQNQLRSIAVTGTNGKSSTVFMVHQLWKQLAVKHMALGTLGLLGDLESTERFPLLSFNTHTTPNPDRLFPVLFSAVQQGITWLVMEVSSHSLEQHRLYGMCFCAVVWTSFSQDHLDVHKSLDQYFAAKVRLLQHPYITAKSAVFIDQQVLSVPRFKHLIRETLQAQSVPYKSVDVAAFGGARSGFPYVGVMQRNFVLAAHVAAQTLEITVEELWDRCDFKQLPQVPGRMNVVHSVPYVIIDYAHSPRALKLALCDIRHQFGLPIICVFGCGGDRDRKKRPLMMQEALKGAETIVLTSDNPRSEDPLKIIEDIKVALTTQDHKRVYVYVHRREAVEYALKMAIKDYQGQVSVLVAGKGVEDRQIIGDVSVPFSDRNVVEEFFMKDTSG